MEYLVYKGYHVLSLDKAVEYMRRKTLPSDATVITFDDGFYSIWKMAIPVLQELNLPGTVYVTTYYCLKNNPVFRLVVQYMFWKTTMTELDLTNLGLEQKGVVRFLDTISIKEIMWKIIKYAESQMEEDQRVRLCKELGNRLVVDYAKIVEKRFLSLMTKDEVRKAAEAGVDIQLHSHRHNLPLQPELVRKEIEQNREVLEPLIGYRPRHFCYPSGIYDKDHLCPLAEMGVTSATTCNNGFNSPDTPPLALFRFLDGNTTSRIEFEAEVSGFAWLLRIVRSRLVQLVRGGIAIPS
jgi:peptidoglycan/xylan/chitin deacetylase (PgdA/CDA1 family)